MATIDTLATQTLEAYRQHQQTKAQQAKKQQEIEEQEAEKKLSAQLLEVFTSEFLTSVELHYEHRYDSYSKVRTTSAYFSYLGENWHLTPDPGENWKIFTRLVEQEQSNYCYIGKGSYTGKWVQAQLLIFLAERKEEQERAKARAAEWEQQRAEILRQQAEEEILRQQEDQVRIAEADQEHARLTPLVEQAIATARQGMWTWPTEIAIEVYFINYCRGSYQDEDGNGHFEYGNGWTASDQLESNGRITIEPAKDYPWSTSAREPQVIKLMLEVHHPVWTVHTFSSVEDLPGSLKEDITVSLPNVVTRQLDEKQRLVEIPEGEKRYYQDDEWVETVGQQPLTWIRQLVDSEQARKEAE